MSKFPQQQLRRYPELQFVDDKSLRQDPMKRARRYGRVFLWVVPALLTSVLLGLVARFAIGLLPIPIDAATMSGIVGGISGGLTVVLWGVWARRSVRLALRRELQKMEFSVCLHCGYDTRR